jgi:hypothetical protein
MDYSMSFSPVAFDIGNWTLPARPQAGAFDIQDTPTYRTGDLRSD